MAILDMLKAFFTRLYLWFRGLWKRTPTAPMGFGVGVTSGTFVRAAGGAGAVSARNVNVWTGTWLKTGKVIATPQYTLELRMDYNNAFASPISIVKTCSFPDDFISRAGIDPVWAQREMTELMLKCLRIDVGVDPGDRV